MINLMGYMTKYRRKSTIIFYRRSLNIIFKNVLLLST